MFWLGPCFCKNPSGPRFLTTCRAFTAQQSLPQSELVLPFANGTVVMFAIGVALCEAPTRCAAPCVSPTQNLQMVAIPSQNAKHVMRLKTPNPEKANNNWSPLKAAIPNSNSHKAHLSQIFPTQTGLTSEINTPTKSRTAHMLPKTPGKSELQAPETRTSHLHLDHNLLKYKSAAICAPDLDAYGRIKVFPVHVSKPVGHGPLPRQRGQTSGSCKLSTFCIESASRL